MLTSKKGTEGEGWQSGCSQSNRMIAVHGAEMNKILEILLFKNSWGVDGVAWKSL